MPVKWDAPPEPIPSWLDPACEITKHNDAPKIGRERFAPMSVEILLALGCSLFGAVSVTANSMNECANGTAYRAFNFGGWKIYQSFASEYARKRGKPSPWFRALGNKSSGDPPWCYYRGFESPMQFFEEWLLLFVPKSGTVGPKHRYKKSGELFWQNDDGWFAALIDGGYKGKKTKANPAGSIAEHKMLMHSALVRWAQTRLGLVADGVWGPKSEAACAAFQVAHALPATGTLDDPTARALLAVPALTA